MTPASITVLPPPPRVIRKRPGVRGTAWWWTVVSIPLGVLGSIACIVQYPHGRNSLLIVTIVFDAFILLSWWFFGLATSRESWLVRKGNATLGEITERRVIRGKTRMFSITFKFKTQDGTEAIKETYISGRAYAAVDGKTAVTVLYDPAHPNGAMPYECLEYEVAG